MLAAFVKVMLEKGWNPVERIWVQARTSCRALARPCSSRGGQSLALEARARCSTRPAPYIGFWPSKLARREAER